MSPDRSTPADLRAYVAAKQDVGDLLRATVASCRLEHLDVAAAEIQKLVVRLADDRFNLAVVGQFKRGKSSLMNAVIGRELLPTGLLPMTSAITALCYGPRETAWLRREGWAREQEISTDELAAFVTEVGNPGNAKGLIEARVELPVRFLRRGLYFIDTPGVGSSRLENTATAYRFLREADAVIFVTSVEAPLSEAEATYLEEIRQHNRTLFVVVNKVDLMEALELEEVLEYLRAQIASILDAHEIRLHPVSARQALEGRTRHDEDALRTSGLAAFEAALTMFLADEQGRTFLVDVLANVLSVLDEHARSLPALRSAAASMRERLVSGAPIAMVVDEEPEITDVALLEEAVAGPGVDGLRRRPASHRGPAGSCPTCAAESRAIFDFFVRWQYELATNREGPRAFAAAGGFCPAHTWQFEQIAAPQDLGVGYLPLIEKARRELEHAIREPASAARARLTALVDRPTACAACRVLGDAEAAATVAYMEQIEADDGLGHDDDAELCLEHLRAALDHAPNDDIARTLMETHVTRLDELVEDMRSYTLKRAAIRRTLVNSRESEAWRRALVQVAGERTARGVVRGQGL